MILEHHTSLGRLARCSWLVYVMATLGLVVPAPGLAWTLGEGAATCLTSNTYPAGIETRQGLHSSPPFPPIQGRHRRFRERAVQIGVK